jgi:SAM-dependent methyltransferase
MFSINTSESSEARYGDTSNFSWIDRRNGKYLISPSINRNSVQAYIGNIVGNKINALKEIYRVLKYGGIFVSGDICINNEFAKTIPKKAYNRLVR